MSRYSFLIGASGGDSAVGRHFEALASELAWRGHAVARIVDGQRVVLVDPTNNPGLLTWPSRRPTHFADARFLARIIRERRPDAVIANFGSVNVMLGVGWMTGVKRRIAWYRTPVNAIDLDWKGSDPLKQMLRIRKRIVYRMATNLIANSSHTATDLQNAFGVKERKIQVFHNTLADPAEEHRKIPHREENLIVCVGRLYPTKGQDVLLRACARLVDEFHALRLGLVGDGPRRGELEALARDLGIADRCVFHGSQGRDAIFEQFGRAQVAVVPSRSEAFGLVVIEAMAMSTPVVASAVGGIPEIIRDGVDGFLVPPDDPDALADKLTLVLADKERARGMGEKARLRFVEHFEQQQGVRAQANWFESLLSGKTGR